MYDPVAGVESAVIIAQDMESFASAIGLEPPERSGWPLTKRGPRSESRDR
jgi:hypothetical protein